MSTKYMGSNALAKLCEIVKSAVSALEAAIPTKTSDLTNDSGFLTTDTFSQTYATKTELQDVDDMVSTKVDATDYALAMRSMDEAKLNKSIITLKTNSDSTTSVAKNTYKSVTSLSLEAGTWVIKGTLQFAANTVGYRAGCIHTSAAWSGANGFQIAATPSGSAVAQAAAIVTLTATTTYHLVAYHTSTSALGISGWMQAVRLK